MFRNSESLKIFCASGFGGLVCTTVALLASPLFWWLGLVGGFAGGYIAYEFRAVLRAIPLAFTAAANDIGQAAHVILRIFAAAATAIQESVRQGIKYLRRPHPVMYPSATVGFAPMLFLLIPLWSTGGINPDVGWAVALMARILATTAMLFVGWVFAMIIAVVYGGLALIGARYGDNAWFKGDDGDALLFPLENDVSEHCEKPATYGNVVRWAMLGIACISRFLRRNAWAIIKLPGRGAYYLIRFIHSDKRVLCGVDGALGGAVNYVFFARPDTSAMGGGAIILLGGFVAAAAGLISWNFVSRRFFQMVPASN